MKKYIEKMLLENAELRVQAEKARLDCLKTIINFRKKFSQIDLETAIKEAKDGILKS